MLLLIMPGPTNTLLATSAATVGLQRSTPLLLSELAGYVVSILAIQFVLGPALSSTPPAALILRIAAGAYLMVLSVRLWTAPLVLTRSLITLRQVFITTLLNPKAFVFALVIIPFGAPQASLYLLAFTVIVPVVGILWIYIGTFLGRHTHPRYVNAFPKAASIILAIMSATLIGSAIFSQRT